MKVKMLENFQEVGLKAIHAEGFEVAMLEKGEVYIVPQVVGEGLVANRKAEEIKPVQRMKAEQPMTDEQPMADEQPKQKRRLK